jgi:hypothetical protein
MGIILHKYATNMETMNKELENLWDYDIFLNYHSLKICETWLDHIT